MRWFRSTTLLALATLAIAQDEGGEGENNNANGSVVDSTVLIIARDDFEVGTASPGLDGYGIPWKKLLVPKDGITLPAFNTSLTEGLYGSIILTGSLIYNYNGAYRSALSNDQWQQIYDYQSAFKVRMVRFNEYPGTTFGAAPVDATNPGCCAADMDQGITLLDTGLFPGANIKANVSVSMKGLYHYPAKITDASTTTPVAVFEPIDRFTTKTVAGVINKIKGREQMVWFASLAPEWSLTSIFLQHAYIHWMTRSLFVGKRKVHVSAQIDDMQIPTAIYYPAGTKFQVSTADLDAHVTWQAQLNTRLPAGSDIRLELGHNGNGNILEAVTKPDAKKQCDPAKPVSFPLPPSTPLEFKKPLGTGIDFWPPVFQKYQWSETCSQLGSLTNWFRNPQNLNAFSHVSHTFSHEELNNATYADAAREIQFNQAWMAQVGIDKATHYSAQGLIPPAITGMKNGDAIKAWADNGIRYAVGDNTRPSLRNLQNKHWPLATNLEINGFDGVWIIPRYTTTIYFNCDTPECILQEWKALAGRTGSFDDLLIDARQVNGHHIFALSADPYMFHQANMRQNDMPVTTVGSQTGKMSLVMSWMEIIIQELTRLTNWPVKSLKHDDIGAYFVNRMTLDGCQPTSKYVYSEDGKSIEEIVISAKDNKCTVPIPVTIPQGIDAGEDFEVDLVGSEPPIVWVTLDGESVTIPLSTPIQLEN